MSSCRIRTLRSRCSTTPVASRQVVKQPRQGWTLGRKVAAVVLAAAVATTGVVSVYLHGFQSIVHEPPPVQVPSVPHVADALCLSPAGTVDAGMYTADGESIRRHGGDHFRALKPSFLAAGLYTAAEWGSLGTAMDNPALKSSPNCTPACIRRSPPTRALTVGRLPIAHDSGRAWCRGPHDELLPSVVKTLAALLDNTQR